MKNELPSADLVRSLVDYSPDTGIFLWRQRPSDPANSAKLSGKRAGRVGVGGYRRISICGREFLAHRLAWLIVKGSWPERDIDHRNVDADDNRFTNLRLANDSQNVANQRKRVGCSSDMKGVTWNKGVGKWQASIKRNGKNIYLGLFTDESAAHEAYVDAAKALFGEFARAA